MCLGGGGVLMSGGGVGGGDVSGDMLRESVGGGWGAVDGSEVL